jgi:hypothetical protein
MTSSSTQQEAAKETKLQETIAEANASYFQQFVAMFKRHRFTAGTSVSTFGLLHLLRLWFRKRKQKIIQKYPEREAIIDLIVDNGIYISRVDMKILWKLLSDDAIKTSQLTKWMNTYMKKEGGSTFTPSVLDWTLGTTLYTHFVGVLSHAIYNTTLDLQDQADDLTRDAAQLTKQAGAAAVTTAAAAASGFISIPNILLSIQSMWGGKDESKSTFMISHVGVGLYRYSSFCGRFSGSCTNCLVFFKSLFSHTSVC